MCLRYYLFRTLELVIFTKYKRKPIICMRLRFLDSVVLLEQIRTIDKSRIIHYIGQVPKKHMRAIDRALGISVEMNKPAYIHVCPACAKMLHSTGTFLLIRNGNISEDEMCSCCKMEFAREYEVRLHTK